MADTHAYYSNLTNVRSEHMQDVSETDVSPERLERGALEAHTLINAKLGRIYSVPFTLSTDTTDPPAIIRSIAETLTACWADKHTKGRSVKSRGPLADECKQARELLDLLASGDLVIAGHSSSVLPDCNTRGEHPIFFKGDVHDMGQDADQASRLADERD